MRKGHPIVYRTATGVLVVEPEKLGELMESLIPCLDPDLLDKNKTKKALAVRFDEKQGLAQLVAESEKITSDTLAANFPVR